MKVTVYHFRVYDPIKDEEFIPPRKSPEHRINRIGAQIIKETAEDVDASALDEQERYDPRSGDTADA